MTYSASPLFGISPYVFTLALDVVSLIRITPRPSSLFSENSIYLVGLFIPRP